MNLDTVIRDILNPALAWLPSKMDTPKARVLVLAIGLQESEFLHRVQMGNGPAHSFWQMERGGGVRGLCSHWASRDLVRDACAAHGVEFTPQAIWEAIATDDVLAAICARLLLYTDAPPLPALTDAKGAWELYARVWRPGKPRPETWPDNHAAALAAVKAS